MTTAFVGHHDCSRHDTGWKHPDHQGRLPALVRAVYRDMLTLHEHLVEVEARHASEEELLLVHTPEYVARVRELSARADSAGESIPVGEETVVSGATWEAALAAAGAALTGVETVLSGAARAAFCAVRPPGSDAGPSSWCRFSIFNNVAIAALAARERRPEGGVLVVEWAASPAMALADILGGRDGVRLVTVAGPARPPGSDRPERSETAPAAGADPAGEASRDAPPEHHGSREDAAAARPAGAGCLPEGSSPATVALLPAGAAGGQYLAALERVLDAALRDFSPELIVLAAGFDALGADPLGNLSLAPADYHPLTRAVVQRAERHCAGRVVSVLEGGFDPAATGHAVVQHLRALAGLPPA